ncbi:hypothetical protein BH24ACI2_BH24ACI2_05040 [soil metagenome]|jgi:NADP-dependent 3-hydroxy acid dehydrogenase YdfG|nr:SDR family NAD(P)-dependent oxidoreductase [Acidobacteriota bacterium]
MQEKVAIIAGASSGIGRAAALLFAKNGAKVVAVGRNEKDLNALRDEAQKNSGTVKVYLADIREATQIEDYSVMLLKILIRLMY